MLSFVLLISLLASFVNCAFFVSSSKRFNCKNATVSLLSNATFIDKDCLSEAVKFKPMIFSANPIKKDNLQIFEKNTEAALRLSGLYSLIPTSFYHRIKASSPFVPHPDIFVGIPSLTKIHESVFEHMYMNKDSVFLNVTTSQLERTRASKAYLIIQRICHLLPDSVIFGTASPSHFDSNSAFLKCAERKSGKLASGSVLFVRPMQHGYFILFTKISYERSGRNYEKVWTNTGGFCDRNESTLEAAIRETYEETNGLISLDATTIDKDSYYFNRKENHVMYFVVQPLLEVYSGELLNSLDASTNSEIEDYAWISARDLLNGVYRSGENTNTMLLHMLEGNSASMQPTPKYFPLRDSFLDSLKSRTALRLLEKIISVPPKTHLTKQIYNRYRQSKEFPNIFKEFSSHTIQSFMEKTLRHLLQNTFPEFEFDNLNLNVNGPFNTALLAYIYENLTENKSYQFDDEEITFDQISVSSPFVVKGFSAEINSKIIERSRVLKEIGINFSTDANESPVVLHQTPISSISDEISRAILTGKIECVITALPSVSTVSFIIRSALDLPFWTLEKSCYKIWKKYIPLIKSDDYFIFKSSLSSSRFYFNNNQIYRDDSLFTNMVIETSRKLFRNVIPLVVMPSLDDKYGFISDDLFISKHLKSYSTFIRDDTHGGMLYHGTNSLLGIFGIITNGFYRSTSGDFNTFPQGAALFGSGLYMSKYAYISQGYALFGMVLSFHVKAADNIRVLNYPTIHSTLKSKLEKEAKVLNMDLFLYLFHVHKIDVIINNHIIVQNTAILEIPRDFSKFASACLITQVNSFDKFVQLWELQLSLGHKTLASMLEFPTDVVASAILESEKILESHWIVFTSVLARDFSSSCNSLLQIDSLDACLKEVFKDENSNSTVVSAILHMFALRSNAAVSATVLKTIHWVLSQKYFNSVLFKVLDIVQTGGAINEYRKLLQDILYEILRISPDELLNIIKIMSKFDLTVESHLKEVFYKAFQFYASVESLKSLMNIAPATYAFLMNDIQTNPENYPVSLLLDEGIIKLLQPKTLEKVLCSPLLQSIAELEDFSEYVFIDLLEKSQMETVCESYWTWLQQAVINKHYELSLLKAFPSYLNGEEAASLIRNGHPNSKFNAFKLQESLKQNARNFNLEQMKHSMEYCIANGFRIDFDSAAFILYETVVSAESFEELYRNTLELMQLQLNNSSLRLGDEITDTIHLQFSQLYNLLQKSSEPSLNISDLLYFIQDSLSSTKISALILKLIKLMKSVNPNLVLENISGESIVCLYYSETKEDLLKCYLSFDISLEDLSIEEMTKISKAFFNADPNNYMLRKFLGDSLESLHSSRNAAVAALQSSYFQESGLLLQRMLGSSRLPSSAKEVASITKTFDDAKMESLFRFLFPTYEFSIGYFTSDFIEDPSNWPRLAFFSFFLRSWLLEMPLNATVIFNYAIQGKKWIKYGLCDEAPIDHLQQQQQYSATESFENYESEW